MKQSIIEYIILIEDDLLRNEKNILVLLDNIFFKSCKCSNNKDV